jgi:hypothetical protein
MKRPWPTPVLDVVAEDHRYPHVAEHVHQLPWSNIEVIQGLGEKYAGTTP